MLNTKTILITTFLLSAINGIAANPIDSIGVENHEGKKIIIHKVDPKESYYSIARRYKIDVKEIQAYNQNIALQIGTIIKVPTQIPFASQQASATNPSKSDFFEYKIVAKDNLNLIAEKFATSVDEIKTINKLSSNNLQIGQVLKVPFKKNSVASSANQTVAPNKPATIVEKVQSDEASTIVEHVVKPKEFLNLIAKNYGTSAEEIKALNNLTSSNLHIGQVLKVRNKEAKVQDETPKTIATPAVKTETKNTPQEVPAKNEPFFEHTVTSGETIYAIAHKYGLTTFQIKTLNNLNDNELKVGQKLKITGTKPLAETITEPVDSLDSETLASRNLKRPASAYGLNRIEERGTAVWIADPGLDASKMLVLHKSAAVGTIIQITNPMTNRSTFAKVVGKFTDNETYKDAIIVMTKAVAESIGALDKRFLCTLTYAANDDK
jgi:LysM repeat protein